MLFNTNINIKESTFFFPFFSFLTLVKKEKVKKDKQKNVDSLIFPRFLSISNPNLGLPLK